MRHLYEKKSECNFLFTQADIDCCNHQFCSTCIKDWVKVIFYLWRDNQSHVLFVEEMWMLSAVLKQVVHCTTLEENLTINPKLFVNLIMMVQVGLTHLLTTQNQVSLKMKTHLQFYLEFWIISVTQWSLDNRNNIQNTRNLKNRSNSKNLLEEDNSLLKIRRKILPCKNKKNLLYNKKRDLNYNKKNREHLQIKNLHQHFIKNEKLNKYKILKFNKKSSKERQDQNNNHLQRNKKNLKKNLFPNQKIQKSPSLKMKLIQS